MVGVVVDSRMRDWSALRGSGLSAILGVLEAGMYKSVKKEVKVLAACAEWIYAQQGKENSRVCEC